MGAFGAQLKKQREQRKLSLEDVALTTKIGTRFLRALEEEHFDQLPGGIFNKGFVRAYARCIGLDEDQAIADYLLASGEVQPKKEAVETAQPIASNPVPAEEGGSSNFPWAMFVVALLIVVLALAGWRWYSSKSIPESAEPATTMAPATDAKTSSAVPTNTPAESAPVTPATSALTQSPAAGAFVVRIKAQEDSWISITVDGKPVVITDDTLEVAAEKSLEAHNEIMIKAGNMGGLDFWFNGKKLPPQGDEGEVKTLNFDANGLRSTVPKPSSELPPPSP